MLLLAWGGCSKFRQRPTTRSPEPCVFPFWPIRIVVAFPLLAGAIVPRDATKSPPPARPAGGVVPSLPSFRVAPRIRARPAGIWGPGRPPLQAVVMAFFFGIYMCSPSNGCLCVNQNSGPHSTIPRAQGKQRETPKIWRQKMIQNYGPKISVVSLGTSLDFRQIFVLEQILARILASECSDSGHIFR